MWNGEAQTGPAENVQQIDLLVAQFNGSDSFIRLNGVTTNLGNPGDRTIHDLYVGFNDQASGREIHTLVGPLVLFPSAPSVADLADLEAAINLHYPIGEATP